jgi:hypothetical protein
MFQDNVPFNFNDPPAPVRSEEFPPLFENSPYQTSSVGVGNDFTFPTSMNLDAFQTQFESGDPDGLIPALEMHRQSMNSMSIPSADSVPDLMGPSMSFDGSPMATTDNSVSFELDWSRLDYNSMQEDCTALQMQIPTPPRSDNNGLKPFVDNSMGASANLMGYNAPNKVSGLSPNAQGNLMLYSPGSGQADDHYDYQLQSPAGADFTLYDQSHRMSLNAVPHMAPPMTHQASAGQYAQQTQRNQPMFPPLNDRDSVLADIQSWAEQSQQGTNYDPYMGPNGEYEYMK